jgi:stage V sporulation protein D (sporulation-specific penicillin-binding protein)
MIHPWRVSLLFSIFVMAFVLVGVRIFYWQVIASDRLRQEATLQHYVEFTIPATRGEILDRDTSPLTLNQPAYLVYAQPRNISNKNDFIAKLTGLLGLDSIKLDTSLSDPTRVWIPLAHKIDAITMTKLSDLHLEGLGFEKEPKRYYPESSMAAQLLGFVGSDVNGIDTGYFGLEGYYDRQLRGIDGRLRMEKDAHGLPIIIGSQERLDPIDGRTLVLWLDKAIQRMAERRLTEGIQKYGAKEGTVTILDPTTGGVLAMASYPSYDPLTFSDFDKTLYKNPIVASSYEPGSTFKALVMAAALDKNLVTPNSIMDESGPVHVGGYAIRTWNNQYHGSISMTQVLEYSSNVGMVYVARKLGHDTLLSTIKRFGFGKPTNVDLEEEASPDLRGDNDWHEIDDLTASFGQGIAVTPIQMVRAIAALANGGRMMEPHMVQKIIDPQGKSIDIPPKIMDRIVSPQSAHIITEMMVSAVDNGEAKFAKPKGYRIAGKTGTAQIPVAGHYDDKKTIASFVGYAPADNPKFVMLVTLREPSSSQWGSETAAPLFFAIARDLFTYWGIPPTK